ncbi:MAG: hypothetical protein ACPGSC_14410, partial [Granulosicoccaceae bacterium]
MATTRLGEKDGAGCADFIRAFYDNVPPDDIKSSSAQALFEEASSFWEFAQTRHGGEPLIRVFNPHFDNKADRAAHTVIEVVTDDMPFLVDSLT